ncbi:MAG: hypothetical protein OEV00_09905, partial [Acidobacteriota bacterium]|nr:hypothetical protein [Acidobacteriota bacterium]
MRHLLLVLLAALFVVPIAAAAEKKELGNKGRKYIFWGFNRGYNSDADLTVRSPDGTFTIHDARGEDRPSQDVSSYFSTTAQYNVRFGWFVSDRWAIEVGTDHMKWVFDNSRSYDITGSYGRQVWIDGTQVDFATAQAMQDARFLEVEHSDGYNYVHSSAQYFYPIVVKDDKRWSLVGSLGGGAGLLYPKTRVQIWDQATNEPRDVDNRFKVSGYGIDVEAKLRFIYRSFFIEAASRHVLG